MQSPLCPCATSLLLGVKQVGNVPRVTVHLERNEPPRQSRVEEKPLVFPAASLKVSDDRVLPVLPGPDQFMIFGLAAPANGSTDRTGQTHVLMSLLSSLPSQGDSAHLLLGPSTWLRAHPSPCAGGESLGFYRDICIPLPYCSQKSPAIGQTQSGKQEKAPGRSLQPPARPSPAHQQPLLR